MQPGMYCSWKSRPQLATKSNTCRLCPPVPGRPVPDAQSPAAHTPPPCPARWPPWLPPAPACERCVRCPAWCSAQCDKERGWKGAVRGRRGGARRQRRRRRPAVCRVGAAAAARCSCREPVMLVLGCQGAWHHLTGAVRRASALSRRPEQLSTLVATKSGLPEMHCLPPRPRSKLSSACCAWVVGPSLPASSARPSHCPLIVGTDRSAQQLAAMAQELGGTIASTEQLEEFAR